MENRVRRELIGMIDDALGTDAKAALVASRRLKAEVEWLTERAVAVARGQGYNWGQISRLLGITRQWARERFKNAPPRLPPHVVAHNCYMADERKTERLLRQLGQPKRRDQDDDPVAW
jgi:hypothetical protein